jgi:O-methyltransferase
VVRANFERYGLLDGQVEFLPGWFKDSLPDAPIEKIAVLRADCDMYESTFEVLTYLYPKVSAGGYVIIDDYGVLPKCKAAVDDYRLAHGIDAPIQWVDWTGVYWQKL